jgi:hypothetical protein
MEEVNFNSINELYERVIQCLELNVKLLNDQNIETNKEDIWNYLSNKWKNSNNLTLFDIVNDIMILDGNNLINNRKV